MIQPCPRRALACELSGAFGEAGQSRCLCLTRGPDSDGDGGRFLGSKAVLSGKPQLLGSKLRQRHVRFRAQCLLALGIGVELRQPGLKLALPFAGAGLLALQPIMLLAQPLHRGGTTHLGVPQGWQSLRGRYFGGSRFGCAPGGLCQQRQRLMQRRLLGADIRVCCLPAQKQRHRLQLPDLVADLPVTLGLPRLTF